MLLQIIFRSLFLILASSLLSFMGSPKQALADEAVERFEKLGKDRMCLAQVVPLDFRFSLVMTVWLADPESQNYLPKVFDILVAKHKAFMDELDAYSRETADTPTNIGDLRAALERSDQKNKDLGVKLADISGIDRNFIDSLNKIEIQLKNVLSAATQVHPVCQHSEELASTLQTIVDETNQSYASIAEMRHYMGQIQSKRIFMLNLVHENVEKDLKSRFADLTNQKLDQIEADVEGVFGLVRFIDDLEDWWFRVVVRKGTARGYLATTFQFNSALAMIDVDLKTLEEFQQRLNVIRSPDGAKQTAQNLMNTKVNFLKTARDQATAIGWEGFLGKQGSVKIFVSPLNPCYMHKEKSRHEDRDEHCQV